jgi:hypothetical protein
VAICFPSSKRSILDGSLVSAGGPRQSCICRPSSETGQFD